jgi:hypothetical protein
VRRETPEPGGDGRHSFVGGRAESPEPVDHILSTFKMVSQDIRAPWVFCDLAGRPVLVGIRQAEAINRGLGQGVPGNGPRAEDSRPNWSLAGRANARGGAACNAILTVFHDNIFTVSSHHQQPTVLPSSSFSWSHTHSSNTPR